MQQEKLTEGESYQFLIHKKVALPNEEGQVMVLIGPDNKRYLLNTSYYKQYNLSIGQNIKCKVDKINCSGHIFLEPEHPHYRIGERYNFLVKRLSSDTNALGETKHIAWVSGLHEREWPCLIDDPGNIIPGYTQLSCLVKRIRKAELILFYPGVISSWKGTRIGQLYQFKIIGEKKFEDEELFILRGPEGKLHTIKKEFYIHYDFKAGQKIDARVVDINPDGSFKIEPDNPFYKIGETYYFKFLRIELNSSGFEGQGDIIWLEDHFARECQVKAFSWQASLSSYHPDSLRCKVVRFRNGKLQLENMEIQPKM